MGRKDTLDKPSHVTNREMWSQLQAREQAEGLAAAWDVIQLRPTLLRSLRTLSTETYLPRGPHWYSAAPFPQIQLLNDRAQTALFDFVATHAGLEHFCHTTWGPLFLSDQRYPPKRTHESLARLGVATHGDPVRSPNQTPRLGGESTIYYHRQDESGAQPSTYEAVRRLVLRVWRVRDRAAKASLNPTRPLHLHVFAQLRPTHKPAELTDEGKEKWRQTAREIEKELWDLISKPGGEGGLTRAGDKLVFRRLFDADECRSCGWSPGDIGMWYSSWLPSFTTADQQDGENRTTLDSTIASSIQRLRHTSCTHYIPPHSRRQGQAERTPTQCNRED